MTQIQTGHNNFYIGNNAEHPQAYISYTPIDQSTWRIDHTVVSPELRHQGIAKKLTLHLLGEAQKQNISIIPECSYAQSFFRKYPEYQSMLKEMI